MAAKKYQDVEATYLYKGQPLTVRFKLKEKNYVHYVRIRVRANPKGLERFDKEATDYADALAKINDWKQKNCPDLARFRDVTTRLSPEQLNDATEATDLLPEGFTLLQCVQAVRRFRQYEDVTVREAFDRYVEARTRTDENPDGKWRSKASCDTAKTHLSPLVSQHGERLIKTIQGDELKKYWAKGSDQTRRNKFNSFRTFFNWCAGAGGILPASPMAKLESPPTGKKKPPVVLSVEQVEAFLNLVSEGRYLKWLPFIAVQVLAGLRAGEVHNKQLYSKANPSIRVLGWQDIFLEPPNDAPYLKIPEIGKKDSNREVQLAPNLVSILQSAKAKGLEVFPRTLSAKGFRGLTAKAGFPEGTWQANTFRHTAITYWWRWNPINKTSDTREPAMRRQFGNSEEVRQEHYVNRTVQLSAAKDFWKLGLEQ